MLGASKVALIKLTPPLLKNILCIYATRPQGQPVTWLSAIFTPIGGKNKETELQYIQRRN